MYWKKFCEFNDSVSPAAKMPLPLLSLMMLLTVTLMFSAGCGDSRNKHAGESKGHQEGEAVLSDEAGEGDTHQLGEAVHMADHMEHMTTVRKGLIKKLGEEKYNLSLPPETEEQRALGKKTFEANCALCHGIGGKGDGVAAAGLISKPADFTDPEHSKFYSDQGRIHIIKNGIEDTPMVGWKDNLSEAQILAVYTHVRSLRSSETTAAADEHQDEHGDHH